jgi:threonine/homoserine/homoserine lactone efflux protein
MTDAIISGFILGLALVFSVGPVIFTILKLRINYGLESAFYFIAGVWISDILWVVTANVFSELIQNIITYRKPIGIAGGGFLISLGIYYLFFKKFHTKEELDSGVKIGVATHTRLFVTGFLINTLNPGVIALWFGATTKTIADDYTMNQKIVTFSICILLNIAADIAKIKLAGKLRRKLTDRNIRIINRISGFLFLVFGAALMIGVLATKTK